VVVGRGLSNFLLFVFHVDRGRWLDDDCAEGVWWKWAGVGDEGPKGHCSSNLYIPVTRTRTQVRACVYICKCNAQLVIFLGWRDYGREIRIAHGAAWRRRVVYYTITYTIYIYIYIYVPNYYISERGFSREGFPGFGRAHAPPRLYPPVRVKQAHTHTHTHTSPQGHTTRFLFGPEARAVARKTRARDDIGGGVPRWIRFNVRHIYMHIQYIIIYK